MSQNESFIDEVTEEVRRDRLFAFFRRWAWLAILIVLVIVGLAAWNEWRKARAIAAAQALGDGIVAALAQPDPDSRAAALGLIEAEGDARAIVDMLAAAATAGTPNDSAATVALGAEASRTDGAARWTDLAALKLILLEAASLSPEERISRLEPLTTGVSPYRLLAQEQIAYAQAELGKTDEALAILTDIVADGRATEGLRLRASQMIVALGGSLEPA
jgi:hypothetical protein